MKLDFHLLGVGYLGKRLQAHQGTQTSPNSGGVSLSHDSGFDIYSDKAWEALPEHPLPTIITIPPLETLSETTEKLTRFAQGLQSRWGESAKIIYISSTAVYPQIKGAFDESFEGNPDGKSGFLRRASEEILRKHFDATCLRPGGIYGEGRHLGLRLAQNKPPRGWDHPTYRIHVDDLAMICLEAVKNTDFPKIMNCVDKYPASAREVAVWLDKAGLQAAPKIPAFQEMPMRVISDDLLQGLPYSLQYPSFKEGLTRIYQDAKTRD
ncbi:MAG: hypothetical protein QNL04_09820 [SAR324 cluster bacterium]|nr:hypothetical protein [SAR324 cluster bacterium]